MSNPWAKEAWRVAAGLLVLLLLGWWSGAWGLLLWLGLAGYLAWHLYQLARLERWLRLGKHYHPPSASGIWDEVYYQIYRLQQRNRKRKRKLAAMLDRFQESTAAMPDPTVVLGKGWDIQWMNEAAKRTLGLHPGKDVGQRIDNLLRHPTLVAFLEQGDYTRAIEIPSPLDDQALLSINIVPYGKDQRLLIARDVTRLRQLEQVRRDFIANISHELRTPLTVFKGFLEMIVSAGDEAARRWQRPLTLMTQQVDRMHYLVERLLLLSRLETGRLPFNPAAVNVADMVRRICDEARALSGERGHRIECETTDALWLDGSSEELRSAFSNLVFNAVRYTPDGGEIAVRWARRGEQGVFSVTDSGVGISALHLPRLTERFYRVDSARDQGSGGTGLGLAIVKHVLGRHGAHLDIASTPGVGSTFSCVFPAAVLRAAPPAAGEERV
ncbi:phosphate regulon sensor histidine kinase PhoR [Ectothiorhodospiraceae bacterium 2226]|nr:phosphate regulon sensor histidine kinase PhoR [Ectothiorhodospiraceae bacterium 2226]